MTDVLLLSRAWLVNTAAPHSSSQFIGTHAYVTLVQAQELKNELKIPRSNKMFSGAGITIDYVNIHMQCLNRVLAICGSNTRSVSVPERHHELLC